MAALPDFLLDPNVVLKDEAQWRFKTAPDYTRTNSTFESTKSTSWALPSLEFLVQNLVKNWEKEASYKTDSTQWRTISQHPDPESESESDKYKSHAYAFHLNGGPPQSAADMLERGTYNALIGESGVRGVYETREMDFGASHKLFKGVMRTFNWEVLEVVGEPPKVSIKWRHWGTMTGNYRAKLSSGRTITAKANNKLIEVFGVTMAEVNAKFEITKLETFWEPESMFRQLVTDDVRVLEAGEGEGEGGQAGESVEEVVVAVDDEGRGREQAGAGAAGCPVAH